MLIQKSFKRTRIKEITSLIIKLIYFLIIISICLMGVDGMKSMEWQDFQTEMPDVHNLGRDFLSEEHNLKKKN